MIRIVPCVLVLCCFVTGCAWFGGGKSAKSDAKSTQPLSIASNTSAGTNGTNSAQVTITPDNPLDGNVVKAFPEAQFAILNFPYGTMPLKGQRLYVYRQGLKVGEVRVTGPTDNDNTVADIVTGEAQKGDEIRVR